MAGFLAPCLFSLFADGCKSTPAQEHAPENPAASATLRPPGSDSWLRSFKVDDPRWSPAQPAPGTRAELWLRLSFPVLNDGDEEEIPFVAYPTILLETEDARVAIRGGGPSVYGLRPGMDCQLGFEVGFDPWIPVGSVIRFRATPSTWGWTTGDVRRANPFEFEVTVADRLPD